MSFVNTCFFKLITWSHWPGFYAHFLTGTGLGKLSFSMVYSIISNYAPMSLGVGLKLYNWVFEVLLKINLVPPKLFP